MTWLNVFDHYVKQFKYGRQVMLALLLVLVLVAALFLYRWYDRSQTEQAHASLAHAIELFEKAERENTNVLWDEADRAFSQGYSYYAGGTLAPYFLAFQSEIAARQNNQVKARELLNKAVGIMSKAAPLYGSYALKLALMEIESGDEELAQKGTASLQNLGRDARNSDHDKALYYQGLLLFEKGDRAAALQVWQPLLNGQHRTDSIWAHIAQAKLDYAA